MGIRYDSSTSVKRHWWLCVTSFVCMPMVFALSCTLSPLMQRLWSLRSLAPFHPRCKGIRYASFMRVAFVIHVYSSGFCARLHPLIFDTRIHDITLRLVGSLESLVSFAKEPYESGDILQKRPMILRSLQIVLDTRYHSFTSVKRHWCLCITVFMCMTIVFALSCTLRPLIYGYTMWLTDECETTLVFVCHIIHVYHYSLCALLHPLNLDCICIDIQHAQSMCVACLIHVCSWGVRAPVHPWYMGIQ